MRRREFIAGLGGAAAWPVATRAQQPTMPVIGYLYAGAPEPGYNFAAAFHKGLGETGFTENRNLAIEYRFANNQNDRLAEMAADLVRRRVAVIATPTLPASLAALAATKSIPIVFGTAADPVQVGLVASLNRPGGNATGIVTLTSELAAKRIGLLHELVPSAERFALLLDGRLQEFAGNQVKAAVSSLGREIEIFLAGSNYEIDAAFERMVQKRPDALIVSAGALFNNRRVQIVTLAAHHRLPAIYTDRLYAEDGGLMTYGASSADMARQVGVYVGRILKGDKPADLPVQQATKFELVINLKTAKALDLTIPETLLATADEVIQ
jgi:putative ABC transport system substrate-binding protein